MHQFYSPHLKRMTAIHLTVMSVVSLGLACNKGVTPPASGKAENKTSSSTTGNMGAESLSDAAAKGSIEVIQQLISDGVDINTKDSNGRSALHCAAVAGQTRVTKFLIDHGADVNSTDLDGRTPLAAMAEKMQEFWSSGKDIPRAYEEIGDLLVSQGATERGRRISDTIMHRYAFGYTIEQAKEALKKGANIDGRDDSGSTALHLAAFAGTTERIAFFLDNGADIDARNDYGQSPLDEAANGGQLDAVKLLLSRGAILNHVDVSGHNALHLVAEGTNRDLDSKSDAYPQQPITNYQAVAELLLEKELSPNSKDHDGNTPLHLAARGGYRDVSESLIRHGADVNAKNNEAQTPYGLAFLTLKEIKDEISTQGEGKLLPEVISRRDRFQDFVNWFSLQGADTTVAPEQKIAAPCPPRIETEDPAEEIEYPGPSLFKAKDGQVAQRFLEQGADINAHDDFQRTPLHKASENGRLAVVQFLIEHGARMNAVDFMKRTPLHYAAEHGRAEVVKYLLSKGADPNATDREMHTPLHNIPLGRSMGSLIERDGENNGKVAFKDTAEALIQAGANFRAKTGQGQSLLQLAASYGDDELVELLLARGVNVNEPGVFGQTALHSVAGGETLMSNQHLPEVHRRYAGIAKRLIEKGADVNAKDQSGSSPLLCAAVFCNKEVAEILVSHGADVNAKSQNGETPLAAARRGLEGVKYFASSTPKDELQSRTKEYDSMIAWLIEHGAKE